MYRGLAQHPAGDKDKLQSSTTTGSIVNITAENQRLCFHFLEGTWVLLHIWITGEKIQDVASFIHLDQQINQIAYKSHTSHTN